MSIKNEFAILAGISKQYIKEDNTPVQHDKSTVTALKSIIKQTIKKLENEHNAAVGVNYKAELKKACNKYDFLLGLLINGKIDEAIKYWKNLPEEYKQELYDCCELDDNLKQLLCCEKSTKKEVKVEAEKPVEEQVETVVETTELQEAKTEITYMEDWLNDQYDEKHPQEDKFKAPKEVIDELKDTIDAIESECQWKYIQHLTNDTTVQEYARKLDILNKLLELIQCGCEESMKRASQLLLSVDNITSQVIPNNVKKLLTYDYYRGDDLLHDTEKRFKEVKQTS